MDTPRHRVTATHSVMPSLRAKASGHGAGVWPCSQLPRLWLERDMTGSGQASTRN